MTRLPYKSFGFDFRQVLAHGESLVGTPEMTIDNPGICFGKWHFEMERKAVVFEVEAVVPGRHDFNCRCRTTKERLVNCPVALTIVPPQTTRAEWCSET